MPPFHMVGLWDLCIAIFLSFHDMNSRLSTTSLCLCGTSMLVNADSFILTPLEVAVPALRTYIKETSMSNSRDKGHLH